MAVDISSLKDQTRAFVCMVREEKGIINSDLETYEGRKLPAHVREKMNCLKLCLEQNANRMIQINEPKDEFEQSVLGQVFLELNQCYHELGGISLTHLVSYRPEGGEFQYSKR